jgi:hypothetical protein
VPCFPIESDLNGFAIANDESLTASVKRNLKSTLNVECECDKSGEGSGQSWKKGVKILLESEIVVSGLLKRGKK